MTHDVIRLSLSFPSGTELKVQIAPSELKRVLVTLASHGLLGGHEAECLILLCRLEGC